MIIVLGDEEEMVHQAHGLLQPWMQSDAPDYFRMQFCRLVDPGTPLAGEYGNDFLNRPRIVGGFIRHPIGQVGDGQRIDILLKIFHALAPQRFKIEQVSGVFLGLPLSIRLGDESVARHAPDDFLQPGRSSPQADAEIGKLFHREVELEFALKPDWDSAHVGFQF